MILEDVQKLSPGNIVEFFEIDCRAIGGSVERYHNHNDGPLIWQGHIYNPWAIESENFERTADGQQPTPTLTVGNIGYDTEGEPITGVVSALCLALNDLVGARLIRRRTFSKYLDAANFPEGNPAANPDEHFPDELWIIARKKSENPNAVSFSLSSPLQFQGMQLPSRQIQAGICGWAMKAAPEGGYRGAWCGYTGSAMFTKEGEPTSDPAQDQCGFLVSDCKLRFGENSPLSYGGFPTSTRVG